MNKLFTQLVKKRGLTDDFLHPKYEDLADPDVLPDMQKAIARIKKAIQNHEKILIYGDYDVDGITASTVMEQALKLAKIDPKNIQIMLPDRFVDGYGMSARLIDRALAQNINLVITVDCGSRNADIVRELKKHKIDTIITDHHECDEDPKKLPKAIAVINPKRPDFAPEDDNLKSLKDLAGVGVAFKLAEALVKAKLIPDGQEKWLLDLVLIGTICDRMTMSHENRILCYYGLNKVLPKTRRKGLSELMKIAKVTQFTSEAIGFQIGPRLNAAGRLDTAEIALNLLRTSSATQAVVIAKNLDHLNQARRTEQDAAVKEIESRGIDQLTKSPVIVESGHWHEGIIGIVAGRLTEKYKQPSFVFTEVEGGIYKGSARSFGDFNLAEALAYTKDTIVSGGGHAAAAGVKIATNQLDNFTTKINEYYTSLHLTDQAKYLTLTPDLETDTIKDFTLDLTDDLKTLEPFGPGHPEPYFCIKNLTIVNQTRMGKDGQHLRLDVKDSSGTIIKLIAFSAPKNWFTLELNTPHSFLVQPIENEFRGVRSVECRLCDIMDL